LAVTWLLSPPSVAEVARHETAHGGLWRVLPAVTPASQPQPLYLLLSVQRTSTGRVCVVVSGGAELRDVIEDQGGQISGARWAPCTSEGSVLASAKVS